MKAWMTAVLALGFGMNLAAFAADMPGFHRGACKADMEKFCKDVKPGKGAMAECMKSHQDELSSECKDNIAAMKERAHGAREACKADVEKFCKDVKPGKGAIIQCLKQHESELSDSCKAMSEHHKG